VIPADGPSLGIAPSGTCTCRSWLAKKSSLMPYWRGGGGAGAGAGGAAALLAAAPPPARGGPRPPLAPAAAPEPSLAPPRPPGRRRPGHAGGDADLVVLEDLVGQDLRRAQELHDVAGRDADGPGLALRDLARDLAADRCDLALEVAQSRLARVAVDDHAQRLV